MTEAVDRLERYLAKDGANGEAWKRFLLWDDLKRAFGPEELRQRRLSEAAYDRFASAEPGLELPVFRDVTLALRAFLDATSPPMADLPALAREAKEHFIARTGAHRARAKRKLVQAMRRLDAYLALAGANGLAWKQYLLWDALERELAASDGKNLVALDTVYHRYHADHVGLELPVFRGVATTLRSYRHLAEQVANEGFRDVFQAHLETLAQGLVAYQMGSKASLDVVGEALGWLERHGQALDIVRATRAHFSQPNLHVQLSQDLIAAGVRRTVDETTPVLDFILGSSISGIGRTVGNATVRLVPDPDRAVIEAVMDLTNHARTVGRNGPAIISSTGETRMRGSKRLTIDADGISEAPAESWADTKTHVTGVGSTKRHMMGRIVRRAAKKRIPKQKGEAESIAARHAEDKLNDRLEDEIGDMLDRANRRFQERFRNPLVRRGEFPRLFHFRTTARELRFDGLHDGPSRLASPSRAPGLVGAHDFSVQLHESLANNYAAGLLAGKSINDEDAQRIAHGILGTVPPQLRDEGDSGPWEMEFAARQPITVRIEDETVTLTVRGRRFKSDGRHGHYAMTTTVRYRLESAGGTVKATRIGDIEIRPSTSELNDKAPMSAAQIGFRTLLKRRFDKIFVETIVFDGLVLPGRMSQAGKLELTQLAAAGGWLTLAWQRDKSADVANVAPSAGEPAQRTP